MGAGDQPYCGYWGCDMEGYAMDIRCDISKPLPFRDNAVSEIYASHVIEHFALWQITGILHEWCRVLKAKSGQFWGFVPNGPEVAKQYLLAVEKKDERAKRQWIANFNGGYTNSPYIGFGEIHYAVYDEDLLRDVLSTAGFYPVMIQQQQMSEWDYRLVFLCGKGQFEPMVLTKPWEEEPVRAADPLGDAKYE